MENLSINDFSDVTLFKCSFLCSTKSFDIGLSVGYLLELVVYGDVLKSVLVLTLSHPLIELFKHTILITDISIDVTKNTTSSVSEFETYFISLDNTWSPRELRSGIWSVQGDVLPTGQANDFTGATTPIV